MDVHENLGDVTEDDIKSAHQRDLDVQDRHGVSFLTYWFNSPEGESYCLVDAPDDIANRPGEWNQARILLEPASLSASKAEAA